MAEIQSLLNDIIAGGSNIAAVTNAEPAADAKLLFDSDAFKEKLAFGIIKDMTKAMMHDEPLSDDSMIDKSIMNHIKNDYKGTCFGYLNDAKRRLKSPLLADVIHTIEEYAIMEEANIKEKGYVSDNHKINTDILKDNPDYQTFRAKLTEETSNMVVNDVANEVLKTRDTPVFDIDDKIKPVPADEMEKAEDNNNGEADNSNISDDVNMGTTEDFGSATSESAIFNMAGTIVTESYAEGIPMTTEQGLEKAICEYCVQQLCFLFKDPSRSPFDRLLK